jgi:RNA polymerase sigma-70 factor (ECF subfamily)
VRIKLQVELGEGDSRAPDLSDRTSPVGLNRSYSCGCAATPLSKNNSTSANAMLPTRVTEDVRSSWTGGTALLEATDRIEDDLALAVHQCQRGAFEKLVQTYEGRLFTYAQGLIGDRADAQEVVQDTFLRAHEALTRRYEEGRVRELALKPWLFRIARNLSFNKRRSKKSTRMDEPLTAFDDGRIGPLVPECTVTSGLERRQERAMLERAMSLLPAEARELIVLRFIEEMSYAEISRTTGLEETVLRGRVFRTLKLLRDALAHEEVAHAM